MKIKENTKYWVIINLTQSNHIINQNGYSKVQLVKVISKAEANRHTTDTT
jgi:hypothetical protein